MEMTALTAKKKRAFLMILATLSVVIFLISGCLIFSNYHEFLQAEQAMTLEHFGQFNLRLPNLTRASSYSAIVLCLFGVLSTVSLTVLCLSMTQEKKNLLQMLEKKTTSLNKAVSVRNEFISIASHEFKTPLTALHLGVNLLKRSLLNDTNESPEKFISESTMKSIAGIETQVSRISKLVENLVFISFFNSDDLSIKKENLNLQIVVKDLVENNKTQFYPSQIEFSSSADHPVYVIGDRDKIEKALFNVLNNAWKFGEGQSIRVEIAETQGEVAISIIDHGVGFNIQERKKLFERFEGASTAGGQRGIGLGLFVARQILIAHGGDIQAMSSLGKGSCFTLKLPTVV